MLSRRVVLLLVVAAVVPATESDAAADIVLRPGAGAILVADNDNLAVGGVASFALGYDVGLEPLLVVPELYGSFGYFGGGFSGLTTRGLGGVRLGWSTSVEPALVLRAGYGAVGLTHGDASRVEGGFTMQVGPALDYRPSRGLTIGAELLYDLQIVPIQSQTSLVHAALLGGSVAFWL